MANEITSTGITLTDIVSGHSGLAENVFVNSSVIRAATTINWSNWSGYARQVRVRCYIWSNDPLYEDTLFYSSQTYDLASSEYTAGSKAFTFTYTPGSLPQYFGECSCEIEFDMNGLYSEANFESEDFVRYYYTAPSIASFSVNRCAEDGTDSSTGTSAEFDISFVITPLGDTNTKTLSVRYRPSGTSTWSDPLSVDISSLGYTASLSDSFITGGTFLSNTSYDIQVSLLDCFLSPVTNTKTIQAADAFVHFSADKTQIAFGKYCESTGTGFDKPGFDLDKTARFRKGTQFDVAPKYVSDTVRVNALATLGIQSGEVNYSISSSSQQNVSITFPSEFSSAPFVYATIYYENDAGSAGLFCWVYARSTSGMSVRIVNAASSSRAGKLQWMAIGAPV